jgi:hypothetical protein
VQHGPEGRPELPVVHDSSEAIVRPTGARHSRRIGAIACATGAAVVIASCGGGSSTQSKTDVGEPIALADCSAWNQASTQERLGTVKELRDFAGGPVVGNNATSPSGTGSVLDDKQAYDLFERYCAQEFARGFKLYKLYERAAAFTGHPAQ